MRAASKFFDTFHFVWGPFIISGVVQTLLYNGVVETTA